MTRLLLTVALGLGLWGCPPGEEPVVGPPPCERDEDCGPAARCVATYCQELCWGVSRGDGGVGAMCSSDSDCVDSTCDQSSREESTCQCFTCPARAGAVSAPVVWEEAYTCIDYYQECMGEGVRVTFELTELPGGELRGEITAGPDLGFVLEGTERSLRFRCRSEFRWEQQDVAERPEKGCWTFSADGTTFYKHSYRTGGVGALGFRCVGAGTRGRGSPPPPVLTCEHLKAQASERDFASCPESPP